MFLGNFNFKIDEKNRLTIPSKWRPLVNDKVMITRGYDNCLEFYDVVKFNEIYAKVMVLSDFELDNRRYKRNFLGNVFDLTLDGSHRILIPEQLLQLADISSEILLVGVGSKVEIWNPQIFSETSGANV